MPCVDDNNGYSIEKQQPSVAFFTYYYAAPGGVAIAEARTRLKLEKHLSDTYGYIYTVYICGGSRTSVPIHSRHPSGTSDRCGLHHQFMTLAHAHAIASAVPPPGTETRQRTLPVGWWVTTRRQADRCVRESAKPPASQQTIVFLSAALLPLPAQTVHIGALRYGARWQLSPFPLRPLLLVWHPRRPARTWPAAAEARQPEARAFLSQRQQVECAQCVYPAQLQVAGGTCFNFQLLPPCVIGGGSKSSPGCASARRMVHYCSSARHVSVLSILNNDVVNPATRRV